MPFGALRDFQDGARLRFTNEMCVRVTKLIEQYLGDDKARPADDVVLRMVLSPRAVFMVRPSTSTQRRRW